MKQVIEQDEPEATQVDYTVQEQGYMKDVEEQGVEVGDLPKRFARRKKKWAYFMDHS